MKIPLNTAITDMPDSSVISYEDAVGLPPASAPVPAPAAAPPVPVPAAAPIDGYGDDHPLTVTRYPPTQAKASPAGASAASAASSAPAGLITYEDATAPDTPHPSGILSNAPDDSYASGALKGLGTAAIKAVGDVAGFPTALSNMTDYLLARAQSKITRQPVDQVLADFAKKKQAMPSFIRATDVENVIPAPSAISGAILSKTGEYVPTTEPGRIAQGAAEAALSSLGPNVGAAAGAGGAILKAAPAMAAGNAAAGAVGQGTQDLTGDPLLAMGAGLIGGGVASAGGAAAHAALKPAVMGTPGIDRVPVIGPMVSTARDNAAAGAILKQSSDPAALRDWAAQPPVASDVPNSPSTLAGTVGNDQGLFQAEKNARNVNNGVFNGIDGQQSAAQQAAITGIQPTGDVFRPGQYIRGRLDAIDAAAQHAEDQLNVAHQAAVSGRAQADQQARDSLVQSFQDAHARATQAATDAAAPLQQIPTPEVTGATLRTAQQEATNAAKQARDELYRAVDPDGTLTTVVTPLKAAKNAIQGAIDPHTGVQPSGAEAKLWSDIDRLPDVVSFRSLQKLDSRVTAAMTDARRNPSADDPEALPRLTQLKSAVMDAIHNGVENQAAHEARLVDAGVMPAEDAMEARVDALRSQWGLEDRRAADTNRLVGRAGGGPAFVSGGGAASGPRSIGTGDEAGGQFRQAPRDPGISAPPLQPNFDAAAAERLAAAKAAQSVYAQTYKNRTVSPVLDTNGYVGQYTMPNGAVPSKAIVAGAKGFDMANAFLSATANDPRAVVAMQDAVLGQLRPAVPPGGLLNLNALSAWKQRYAGALRALDVVSPGFSARYDNAANATQALLDLGVHQRQALADLQTSQAAEALSANLASSAAMKAGIAQARGSVRDAYASAPGRFATQVADKIAPTEVENIVGAMLKTGKAGATNMRSLVGSVAQDPDALAGLRKAGVDYIVREFQNADGTVSGARLIDFIRDNKDTLKELFPSSQVSMFGAVARNIEANAKWRTATAIKSGSDTAQNLLSHLQDAKAHGDKHTSMLLIATEGMREGYDHAGISGAVGMGGIAASIRLMNSLRQAGIKSVAQLYQAALADPEKARLLISKMPDKPEGGKLRALTGLLRKELIVGPQAIAAARSSSTRQ